MLTQLNSYIRNSVMSSVLCGVSWRDFSFFQGKKTDPSLCYGKFF